MKSIAIAGNSNARVQVLEIIGSSGLGGMENYIKNFIEHLPPEQFQVTCVCPYESPFTASLRELGVEDIYVTPVLDDPAWRSIQLSVEVARLHDIDILHAHMPKAHALAGLAGSIIHKPVIASIHGMNVTTQELGITRAVNSHLITNCQEAYAQALAMGVPGERVNLVRNSVDPSIFTPDSDSNALRTLLNLPPGTPLVGFVGRLEHEKGPDIFINVADHVHQARPDVHFVIVGEGLMHKKLEQMCVRFGIEKQVHFLGWQADTTQLYPALDLLVHTSRSDGTSLVLLEAMSCGCPTIGLAVGGVPEIIENERTGFVAGAGDWEAVGFRVLQLLQEPKRLQSMKIAARDRVKKQFDLAINTKKIADLMRHIAFSSEQVYGKNGTKVGQSGSKVSMGGSAS